MDVLNTADTVMCLAVQVSLLERIRGKPLSASPLILTLVLLA